MARRFLVTGGAGFIGSNFIRMLLEREHDVLVTNLDALTYAGVRSNVEELSSDSRHRFLEGDITDASLVDEAMRDVDVVVHFAAESHVDRSISQPRPFIQTNVLGTGVLLEAALQHGIGRFVHVSTDEVYGSIDDGHAREEDGIRPSSPYSSSKAGADLLALSYHTTYDLDVVVTRCTNNYGPYQFPEKVIPLFVTNLLDGKKVPLYGTGANERDWLYVEDHCAALILLIDRADSGEVYNIGANAQLPNIELTRRILNAFGLDETWIDWIPDRLGHDLRYAVDSSKMRSLGWSPEHDFDEWLSVTIAWYRDREDWWRPLKEERS